MNAPVSFGEGRRRVAVTGYGAMCSLGHSASEIRAAVRDNVRGLRTITRFDPSGYDVTIAGEVPDFRPEDRIDRKQARRMDRFTQFAMAAALEAVEMSGVDIAAAPDRVGVVAGTAFGGVETFTRSVETLVTRGPRRLGPFSVPMVIPNMAPGLLAIELGATGPAFAYASAFTSAANAIGEAMRMIQQCRADVMVCGGSEAPIVDLMVAGFDAMGSLSHSNADPGGAVKPFDLNRNGCALGEGGAMLVLEAWDHAIARGATIVAELVGYGSTADAYHDVQIAPGGEGLVRAMRLALDDAAVSPSCVGYVNAHGTGTAMNDAYETIALRTVFREIADRIPISGTKSRTGHLLGAAGALEAVLTMQAMEDGVLPSTLNLETPDPACDLDYISGTARVKAVEVAMSNSMGFGGHNVSLIFRRPDRTTQQRSSVIERSDHEPPGKTGQLESGRDPKVPTALA
ncbi:MAG TPA: beta-ketoacyl-ACP synthase II [Thermomicrobiales bacterium]|nr:beta-ketoacyl-ACP synthase II [Thermomicrobiales bacterium]